MHSDVLTGRDRLATVVNSIKDVDDSKRSTLRGLADVDALKQRVETAGSALREVGSWERKIRDCEQMVNSGNLPTALKQLSSLKEVLAAFRMLPEYPKKEEQLGQVQESLLSTTRRKAKLSVERNTLGDLQACCEVFTGLQKREEVAVTVNTVLLDLSEKAWQSRGGMSTSDLGGAVRAVLDSLAQAVSERWPLLKLIEKELESPNAEEDAPPASVEVHKTTAVSTALLTVLNFLGEQVEVRLSSPSTAASAPLSEAGLSRDEATAHVRASQAIALLAAYVDGFLALHKCPPPGEGQTLWPEVCSASAGFNTVPWGLMKEVAHCIVWQPMQDDATALLPPASQDMRAAEAVLTAESNAKRLLELPAVWARRLEDQGAARFAVVWLACVDATCSRYWRGWSKLIGVFQNTLQAALPKEGEPVPTECHYDANLLSECMQLHRMLHESLPARFVAFQAEVLAMAARLLACAESAFGDVVKMKLSDPSVWCDKLGIPSADALRNASSALEGASPDSAVLAARATQALPQASAALAGAEKEVRALVVRCCVQPVQMVLGRYAEAQEWRKGHDADMLGGSLPLKSMTAVGEHLFALVPQLERSQDSAQLQWLPTILEAVVETAMQKALQIKHLSAFGAQQLFVDMEYLQKVASALGSDDSGAASTDSKGVKELSKLLETLTFLAGQQRRQQECMSKGETFAEEHMPVPTRFERPLRVAMGLERSL